ncbi:MAG: ABC-F family ATP-binding cassette domain-containing protein [Planctomycetota bacterium]
MSVLFQICNAYKSFGDQVLLDNAEATITDDAKIGFVGRNGAGKSTLLRILLGDEDLDAGEVIRHPRLRIGYLRQHDPFQPDETVVEFLMRDSGQPEWKCGQVAGQFELKGDYLFGKVASLSGGWQTRVKLAALLLHEPNLLLLDEPTNFLDLRTQILLEHFLQSFREACLIVSHDRTFLSKTCEHTLDLSGGKLTMYPGKIAPFLEFQAERREQLVRENAAVLSKAKQLEKFINKNRANANTASQARSKQKQLDRLKLNEIETEERTAYIQAPIVVARRGPAVRCEELAIGYPDHLVADSIQIEIEHGQRAAIVGDNGQGKTTLLRTLVGSLDPLGGGMNWGHHCRIGTYAQHVYTSIDPDDTVLEYLEQKAMTGITDQQILAVAGSLLFRDEHVHKKVKVLSGGERARLCMAGLLLGDYNILVLDEPGNHLDVETVEALASALEAYLGTVIFTSHDRHFMGRVATNVIEVRDGSVKNYLGDYDAYLYSINREIGEGDRDTAIASEADDPNQRRQNKTLSQNEQRALKKQVKSIERKIARLDEEKKSLNQQLLTTTDAEEAMNLHEQIQAVADQLSTAEEEWLSLCDFE